MVILTQFNHGLCTNNNAMHMYDIKTKRGEKITYSLKKRNISWAGIASRDLLMFFSDKTNQRPKEM